MAAMYDFIAAKFIKHNPNASSAATLSEILEANDTLDERWESITAIFTGATHGIGLGTLRVLLKRIPKPRAIIVGRSQSWFHDEMKSLESINPAAELTFIEGELGTIKGVDAICDEIQHVLGNAKADLLCMSQGYAPLEGRTYNTEGVDLLLQLVYYGRMRMIQNLLDVQAMKSNARIVSILAGTYEGKIHEDDLALERNYSLLKMRAQFASLTTLSLDDLARKSPEMGFLHIFPGKVKSGFMSRSLTWTILRVLMAYVLEPILTLGGITMEECGERMLWMALSERHGQGTWSLNFDGSESQSDVLMQSLYRLNDPLRERIRTHLQDTFQKTTAL